MNDSTDYTVREVTRHDGGRVTYTVVDLAGHVRHVTVDYRNSTPGAADPIIRNAIATTPVTGRADQ